MTNQKQDAIIAGAIEDKPESDRLVAYSPGGAWYRDTVIIIDRDNRSRQGHWKPRPFISAPTWELEGIVLEWVQKSELTVEFIDILYNMQNERAKDIFDQSYYLLWRRHKLGDWA